MVKKFILNDTPANLVRKYREVLIKKGIPVEKIIVFGSYAKGNPKPWSDLDLCIVSKNFGKDRYDEMVQLVHIASPIDSMIEPHPYNSKDLEDPFDPLAHEIKTHGKIIA